MTSFLEYFSPLRAWGRLWDTPRPRVADHGSGEDSRFEEMLKYDTIPTLTPGVESGFGEGEVSGRTSGGMAPTRETVATSTPMPGAPPYPSEASGMDKDSFCEAKRFRGGGASDESDGMLARESRRGAKRAYSQGPMGPSDAVDTPLGAWPRSRASEPCVSQLGPVLQDRTSEHMLPQPGTGSRSCAHEGRDDLLPSSGLRDRALGGRIPPPGQEERCQKAG